MLWIGGETCQLAAKVATDVYLPPLQAIGRCPSGYVAKPLALGGIAGMVYASSEQVLIAFRGSDLDWRDWVLNFAAWPRQLHGRRGHAGYSRAVDAIWSQVERGIGATIGSRSVLCTGHSQGGGLAEMTASRLLRIGVSSEQIRIVTFGAPPVWAAGDSPPVDRARIVYDDDMVPLARIPFAGLRQPPDMCWMIDSENHSIVRLSPDQAVQIHIGRVITRGILRGRIFRRIRDGAVAHKMSGYKSAVIGRAESKGVKNA